MGKSKHNREPGREKKQGTIPGSLRVIRSSNSEQGVAIQTSSSSKTYLAVSSLSPSTPRMRPPACSQSAKVSPMQSGMSTSTTCTFNIVTN